MLRSLVFVVVMLAPSLARADAQTRQAVARRLFEDGIHYLDANRVDAACPKLVESLEMWPDSGTRSALAECYTLAGKLGSAWQLWSELATSAPTAEMRAEAAANAGKLEPRLARVVFKLVDPVPRDLEVTINSKPVAPSTTPIAVDPGTLDVVAIASGVRWAHSYSVVEGSLTLIDVPLIAYEDRGGSRSGAGAVVASIGGVGLAIGLAIELNARSHLASASGACGVSMPCSATEMREANRHIEIAKERSLMAIALCSAGTAALVGGIVLYFRAPRRAPVGVAPMVGPGSVGLVLSGRLP